jgi:TPR repeat protein
MNRLFFVILITLFSISCTTNPVNTTKADYGVYPTNYVEIVKNHLRDKLFDPFSARYRMSKPYKAYTRYAPIMGGSTAQYGYVVDVAVNAKNKLGAYVGEQRFRLFIKNGLTTGTVKTNTWFSEPWFKSEFSNPLSEISQSETANEKPIETGKTVQSVQSTQALSKLVQQVNPDKLYEDGLVLYKTKDYKKALELFLKAANEGHAKAQFKVGRIYDNAEGVPDDDATAIKWFIKSAELGYPDAQVQVGWMYQQGEGVPQDFDQALTWFLKAAEQKLASAYYHLASLYIDGKGVSQDFTKAAYWFEKGAKQGKDWAQYNLGIMYHEGIGVSKDLTKAHRWLTLSAKQGNQDAINLKNIVEKELTPKIGKKKVRTTSSSKKRKKSRIKKKRLKKIKPKRKSGSCARKTCSQMSCKEAWYQYKNCGAKKRLDRNKDGIPCNKQCGR